MNRLLHSAEYGRFTGGVVNAITKSGGNQIDGSLRVNFENEDWESATPLTTSQADNVDETYEATLGGYFLKDHLWFFAAGTRGEGFRYWAPTFCAECDDEQRDNENLLAKGSYFLSSESAGTHDIVFGYDTFEDVRFVVNHQTGSDFTAYGSDVVRDAGGDPVIDPASGSAVPIFDPDGTSSPWIRWFAVFNEDLARPTSFTTNSFYVNDSWQLNDKWSFNIGARLRSGAQRGGLPDPAHLPVLGRLPLLEPPASPVPSLGLFSRSGEGRSH